jgi:hypothetical protein
MDSTNAMIDMQKRLELLHPEKQESWNINCMFYVSKKPNPPPNESKELLVFTYDKTKPKKCYMMAKNVVLEADKEMLYIITQIKLYQIRQNIQVTVCQHNPIIEILTYH